MFGYHEDSPGPRYHKIDKKRKRPSAPENIAWSQCLFPMTHTFSSVKKLLARAPDRGPCSDCFK